MQKTNNNLFKKLLKGDRLALSRSISLVENDDKNSPELLDAIHTKIGKAYRIGVTGPPGAGKSTIIDELVKFFRKKNKTVGVIAVDPTSPFTGGALLGDRIRMNDLILDEGVFIRSMATRGSLGGLSIKANDAADILDAFGKDYVILETVGVGQSELEIVEAVDTTVVVLVPESGDSVQAMKAGLMEIADIFVLNKADRDGADKAIVEIQSMLHLRKKSEWQPEVVKAIAIQGEGIDELADQIDKHRKFLQQKKLLTKKRRERASRKIQSLIRHRLEEVFWDETNSNILQKQLDQMNDSQISPNRVVEQLLKNFKRKMEKHHE